MYVATRELELQTRKAKPGEEVPEALHWTYPILVAHLNMGWIKYVGDGGDRHPDDQTSPSTMSAAPKPAAPPIKASVKTEPVKQAPALGEFKCEIDGKVFKTQRALKIHVTTAHKK